MEEPKIIINAKMEKEDYKKFLYTATFKRNKFTIPILVLMAMVAGLFIGYEKGEFSLIRFLFSWLVLLIVSIFIVVFQIRRKNEKGVKADNTAGFDNLYTLKFYNEKLVVENQSLKSRAEISYDKIFSLLESKDLFILYFTKSQASAIMKRDIDDLGEFKEFIIDKFKDKYKKI
jgi:hypothetical protein